jgi:hypothetical protein
LHLALGAVASGVLQVRYKLWQQGRGWDRVSTEVTLSDGWRIESSRGARFAAGDLSVLYTRLAGGQLSFMERRRELNPQTPDTRCRSRSRRRLVAEARARIRSASLSE